MQALSRAIRIVWEQLRGFSPTAKLLVGCLLVILVMGLALVGAYAGRADMVSLNLDGPLSADARARAVSYLDAHSINWEDRNGAVYVPADQRLPVLANLTENQHITTDQIDFESILQDDSPFTDRDTKSKRFLVAKMNVVARMISELSGVERATVVIDPGATGIGRAHVPATASVKVLARGDDLTQDQADAIARMVAGAHAPLKVQHVTVVDARTMHAFRARTDEQLGSTEHLELKRAAEAHVRGKIDEFLSHIPGVKVAVNAQIDASRVTMRRTGVDDPKQGVNRERSVERTSENQSAPREPGVRSNTGLDLTGAAGRASSESLVETDVRMTPAFGSTQSDIRKDRGYALKINATVLVPRSYFVGLYRQSQQDGTVEPDETALEPLVQGETARIRDQILPLIDTGAADGAAAGTVVVSTFADFATAGVGVLGPTGTSAGGASTGGGLVSDGFASDGIIRHVGLGALAVISLTLMFALVRRAGREENLPTAAELVGIPPALAETDSDLVGEADESPAALEGVEVAEVDVRRQQMLDQINDLAMQTPDEAALLLRKWMRTDDYE
jgi:flagellar biosynthesis/type III secretory pathway M-ring protein FliF/YscJ